MAQGRSEARKWDEERSRTLPRLLPLWPHEIADRSHSARLRLLSKLMAALRQERARSGHWSYDLNRHIALARAVRFEAAAAGFGRSKRPAAHAASRTSHH